MPIYYVNIDVRFRRKLHLIRENGSVKRHAIRGFMCEIGATYPDEATLKSAIVGFLLEKYEGARGARIAYDWIGIIDEADLHREVYEDEDIRDSLHGNPMMEGIWYTTGFGFYW